MALVRPLFIPPVGQYCRRTAALGLHREDIRSTKRQRCPSWYFASGRILLICVSLKDQLVKVSNGCEPSQDLGSWAQSGGVVWRSIMQHLLFQFALHCMHYHTPSPRSPPSCRRVVSCQILPGTISPRHCQNGPCRDLARPGMHCIDPAQTCNANQMCCKLLQPPSCRALAPF
jgi:hypothetical protein